jgi:hypothetical protein
MATTNVAVPATKRVQRTVFDLGSFSDVTLVKNIILPKKPESVEEALTILEGDKGKLLEVIYDGLVSIQAEKEKDALEGFAPVNEDGTLGPVYSGSFASEEQGKQINAIVLNFAKLLGYDNSRSADEKRKLKEQAIATLKQNPAMLAALTKKPAAPEETPSPSPALTDE